MSTSYSGNLNIDIAQHLSPACLMAVYDSVQMCGVDKEIFISAAPATSILCALRVKTS